MKKFYDTMNTMSTEGIKEAIYSEIYNAAM